MDGNILFEDILNFAAWSNPVFSQEYMFSGEEQSAETCNGFVDDSSFNNGFAQKLPSNNGLGPFLNNPKFDANNPPDTVDPSYLHSRPLPDLFAGQQAQPAEVMPRSFASGSSSFSGQTQLPFSSGQTQSPSAPVQTESVRLSPQGDSYDTGLESPIDNQTNTPPKDKGRESPQTDSPSRGESPGLSPRKVEKHACSICKRQHVECKRSQEDTTKCEGCLGKNRVCEKYGCGDRSVCIDGRDWRTLLCRYNVALRKSHDWMLSLLEACSQAATDPNARLFVRKMLDISPDKPTGLASCKQVNAAQTWPSFYANPATCPYFQKRAERGHYNKLKDLREAQRRLEASAINGVEYFSSLLNDLVYDSLDHEARAEFGQVIQDPTTMGRTGFARGGTRHKFVSAFEKEIKSIHSADNEEVIQELMALGA